VLSLFKTGGRASAILHFQRHLQLAATIRCRSAAFTGTRRAFHHLFLQCSTISIHLHRVSVDSIAPLHGARNRVPALLSRPAGAKPRENQRHAATYRLANRKGTPGTDKKHRLLTGWFPVALRARRADKFVHRRAGIDFQTWQPF